uniref:Glutamic acid-rich protein-like n=1 Tax=Diabrotica virgifera virgifera TaxID=50390 RepID=A0A6P7FKK4_DIAVI
MDDDTCEHHPRYLNQIKAKSVSQPGDEKYTTSTLIRDELEYASNYRAVQKRIPRKEVYPKNRPFELPFELCRLKQLQKRKKKKGDHVEKLTKKPTMLERSIMSQDEYMRWLAMPNIKKKGSDPKPKKVKRCQMSPCPPRCVQLSAPPKRRVLSTWTEYQDKLPAEVLLRFQQMLHTDQNLKLRDADYYYKKIDKRKRRLAKRKKRLRLKRKLNKERGKYAWIGENISDTTRAILEYLRQEPLYSLNYKQLLLSDQILNILDEKNVLSKPSRTSKNTYQKCFIETSDKLAVWMDTLTKFVDVQAVESAEDIPPITISTLIPEEEEEEEEIEEEVEEVEEGEDEFITEEEEEYEESVKVEYEDGRDIEKEYEQEEIAEERDHIGEIEAEDGEEGMIYDKEEFEKRTAEVDEKIDHLESGEEGEADFDDKKESGIIEPGEKEKLSEEVIDLGPLDIGEEFGEEYIGKLPDDHEKDKYEEMDLDLLKALIQIYEERSPSDYLRNQVNNISFNN